MPPKPKTSSAKGPVKRSSKPMKAGTASKAKKAGSGKPAPKPTQQKTKSKTATLKKKPPHMRYTEQQLKVPKLNGIVPASVQKPPNAKKGKKFVDDKEQMSAILALVLSEKEGNIESKMMRARQLEEVREARRLEAEKRVESKKAGLEERKQDIKDSKRKRHHTEGAAAAEESQDKPPSKKPRKRVSFG